MNPISRRRFFETAGSLAGASLISTGCTTPSDETGEGLPKLTLTCSNYLRYSPLATGGVRPKGLDLRWVRGPRSEMLRRALSDPEVDGGETSMLGHLLRVDQGDHSHVAIPVFLLRNFTARDLYVKKGSSLMPDELNGKRVGIYNWTASGAVWYRHLLRYFGQDPKSIHWVVGGTDQPAQVQSRVSLPSNVTDAPADKSLTDLLLADDLDAIYVPLPPEAYHPVEGPIVRLIPDYPAVEKKYFEETQCYPPQHVLVLRREVWEGNPSLGPLLVETFAECEARFQEDLHMFPYTTPWQMAEVEETDLLMGPDYHAHGLEKNHHVLDVFCQGGFDDGQTERRITVEEYFAEFLKA
jgi:4,5-dihydroxyphthalate decarboxylase